MPVLLLAVSAVAVAPEAHASADTTTPSIVLTMHGDPLAWVAQNSSVYLHSDVDDTLVTSLSAGHISLRMTDHATGADYDLAADPGADAGPFRTGEYGPTALTQAHGSRNGGLYLDVGGHGRGCGQAATVRIVDLATSGTSITRLDLVFVMHCDGDVAATFGELQVNEPAPAQGAASSARTIQWPDTDPRVAATPVPVVTTNTGTSDASVVNRGITGVDAESFSILGSDCPSVLAAGHSCTTTVGFLPGARALSTASLVQSVNGQWFDTALIGPATDGVTELDIDGSAGEPVSDGARAAVVPENARVAVYGDRSGVTFASTDAPANWTAVLTAPAAAALTLGTHPFGGGASTYGLRVTGNGVGCNTTSGSVTIRQLETDPLDGSLARVDATFEQFCDNATAPLRGRIRYDATTPDADPVTVDTQARTVTYGSTATVHGLATPNAPVTVLGRRRGSDAVVRLATTRAATDGSYTAAFRALDDYTVLAQEPSSFGAVSTTVSASSVAYRIAPTLVLGGSPRPARGTRVPLGGTANPHQRLVLVSRPIAGGPAHSTPVDVTAGGRWATTVVASTGARLTVVSTTNGTSSGAVTFDPR